MDLFNDLINLVMQERREKIETAVERMVTDPQQRGVLIIENQYGVILSADLNEKVPYGTVMLMREDVDYYGAVAGDSGVSGIPD